MRAAGLLSAGLVALALPAAAQSGPRLYADLSVPRVEINYGFAGAEVLVYGAVQYPRGRVPRAPPRIAVVARGPEQAVTVRAKERVAGIWINARAADLATAPAFVAVLTSHPIEELVDERTAAIWELGLGQLQLSPSSAEDAEEAAAFEAGLIDLRRRAGLYVEEAQGVRITDSILYRARLAVPSSAPVGTYQIAVHLIEDGAVTATLTRELVVEKTGFEARISRFAEERSFAYGLSAIGLALLSGWAGSLVGRRQ